MGPLKIAAPLLGIALLAALVPALPALAGPAPAAHAVVPQGVDPAQTPPGFPALGITPPTLGVPTFAPPAPVVSAPLPAGAKPSSGVNLSPIVPSGMPPQVPATVDAKPLVVSSGGGAFVGVVGLLQVQLSNPADAQALAQTLQLTVREVSLDKHIVTVSPLPGTDLTKLLERLRGDPRVRAADLSALEFVRPGQAP